MKQYLVINLYIPLRDYQLLSNILGMGVKRSAFSYRPDLWESSGDAPTLLDTDAQFIPRTTKKC